MQIIKDWKTVSEKHIHTIKTFLELKETKELHEEYKNRSKDKSEIGFNVFTISSDFYYRENYHSDIIKSFLDPQEKHNEGSKYLYAFIDLINKSNNKIEISKKDFENSIVQREPHKIDILITDSNSKKAIIIENKINNAVDQQRQLPRYVKKIKEEDYDIVAIVYLTLNSSKHPDKSDWQEEEKEKIDSILTIIPAYDTSKINLFNNWIIPSIIISQNIDSSFLLRQYGNLIKYLNTNTMDTTSLEKFYNTIQKSDNFTTAKSIINMLNDLPEYLIIRIEEEYKERCCPFNKIQRWKSNWTYFDGFEIDDLYFKLDIVCDIKGYRVYFWDQNSNFEKVIKYQEKIEVLSSFKESSIFPKRIVKRFNILEENILFEFINKLLEELKEIKKGTI